MELKKIGPNEAGQRFDKYLCKYLNKASISFIYKMLRKKNIVLNGKKANGNEKLKIDDEIKFFLADETIEKFRDDNHLYKIHTDIPFTVIYEDDNICIMNKPVGILSQKSKNDDVSISKTSFFSLYSLNL